MNISHMARAMIGDMHIQVQDAKALELKVGQIVRGVVLQMLEGQEALVSINGTQIRANLQTPLQVGQSTWLQVQPDSTNGQLVLKAATSGGIAADEMLLKLMQELGLKDTPVNRELLKQAQDMGVQLTTRDAKALSAFVARDGAPVDASRWMQSALLAVQRGLPLTEQTVQSIAQVLHGRPLPQLLQSLLTDLTRLTGEQSGRESAGLSEASRQLVMKLTDAIGNWMALAGRHAYAGHSSAAGTSPEATGHANEQLAGRSQEQQVNVAGRPSSGPAPGGTGAEPSLRMGELRPAMPASGAHTGTSPLQGQPAAGSNGLGDIQAGGGEATARGNVSSDPSGRAAPSMQASQMQGTDAAQLIDRSGASSTNQSQSLNGSAMRQLLQFLGMGHEHELLEKIMTQSQPAVRDGAAGAQAPAAASQQPAIDSGNSGPLQSQLSTPQAPAETLKSLLLQAAANEQLPAALRETLQQAAQSITGQQLLLSSERSAPLSYVTLFVPFLNEKGEHMASVHIQTRKGKRGQLDSQNCHLFFDLRLASLGEMMIDVQVTDRIVTLKVFNDHPLMQALIESGKPDMQQAIERLGYRLSSIKAAALPQAAPESPAEQQADQSIEETPQLLRYMAGSSYKGVDLRI